MRSTPVGPTSPSKLREIWHHLPVDEKTHRQSWRIEPDPGPQHGEDRGSPTLRKDVGPVTLNYTNDRNPESFVELDGFSASPCHHCSDHCRDLCPEKANHSSAQPSTIAILKNLTQTILCTSLFLRDKETFCSWGRCRRSNSTQVDLNEDRLSRSAD